MAQRKQFKAAKAKMMRRQKDRCFYCGSHVVRDGKNGRHSAINEHRVPLSRGGMHSHNLVVACGRCDGMKGDLTDVEFICGVKCAGGFNEYEAAHKRALLMNLVERAKRRDIRRQKFFNPEQHQTA